MLYSLLLIVAIGVSLFAVSWWKLLPPQERKTFAKKGLIYGAAITVLALVLIGKAHWLMGVLAALLALAGRATQFIQYVPLFKKFMENDTKQHNSSAGSARASSSMNRQQAADILGVDINANERDIKSAHKRLMQKMHPDRGGSEALAKQINLAKDVLLKR